MVFDMIMSSCGSVMVSISIFRNDLEVLLLVGFHLEVALSCPYATNPAALRGFSLRRHFGPTVGV